MVDAIEVIGGRVGGRALSALWIGAAMETVGQWHDCFCRGNLSALSEEAKCLQLCDSEVEL